MRHNFYRSVLKVLTQGADKCLMVRHYLTIFFMGLLSFALLGCVGPSSPFGALNLGTGDGRKLKEKNYIDDTENKFNYQPRRQILHEPRSLKVIISEEDVHKDSEKHDIRVEYNGRDVTHAFRRYLRATNAHENSEKVMFAYDDLKLSPAKKHDIRFYYRNKTGKNYIRSQYLPPRCSMDSQYAVITTSPFQPQKEWLEMINDTAKKYEINPALLSALIAQESGFNSNAKSRKNAVGLTQITTIGAEEIERVRPEWREKRVGKKQKDWRKNPQLAIEGGGIYLNYLRDYWSDPESKDVRQRVVMTNDATEVLLASYNSGAARVKKNMQDHGTDWLQSPQLKEAFRYVNSITSYCYHFAGEPE